MTTFRITYLGGRKEIPADGMGDVAARPKNNPRPNQPIPCIGSSCRELNSHVGNPNGASYSASSSSSFPGPFSLLRSVRTLMPSRSAALVRLFPEAVRAC